MTYPILNGKIQMDGVEKALIKIKKGKASGIDGIPIECYSSDIKYFTPLLTTLPFLIRQITQKTGRRGWSTQFIKKAINQMHKTNEKFLWILL